MHSITNTHTRKRLHEAATVKTSASIFLLHPSSHLTSSLGNKSRLQRRFIHRDGCARLARGPKHAWIQSVLLSAGYQRYFRLTRLDSSSSHRMLQICCIVVDSSCIQRSPSSYAAVWSMGSMQTQREHARSKGRNQEVYSKAPTSKSVLRPPLSLFQRQ